MRVTFCTLKADEADFVDFLILSRNTKTTRQFESKTKIEINSKNTKILIEDEHVESLKIFLISATTGVIFDCQFKSCVHLLHRTFMDLTSELLSTRSK